MDFGNLVKAQREYYLSGATRSLTFRLESLNKLRGAIKKNQSLINDALKKDLNKDPVEVYMCETGMVLEEIGYLIKHLPKLIKDRRVKTPLAQFPAKSFVSPEPYGVSLIMSPWNYPIQLCLSPLAAAISGGNCSVVKPSVYTSNTSHAISELVSGIFPPEYIAVVEGGREQNSALLDERFDYIFFTGSVSVGKVVMEAASRHLTPVTLELGGKSPAIVDETADVPIAARRIAFGKVLNAGQTCVEPDYLFIHEKVKDQFIDEFRKAIESFFPGGDMSEMPVIINEKHFERVTGLIKSGHAVVGGGFDASRRFIEPTLLDDVTPEAPIMQEEIFGPLLPMIRFNDISECIYHIRSHPKPLALYLFTGSKAAEDRVLSTCSFGGGCINDTIIHLATTEMPFGGVGSSGIGSYHGKHSFDTFTHYRSIVKKSTKIDLPMRYHPYTQKKENIIKKFLK